MRQSLLVTLDARMPEITNQTYVDKVHTAFTVTTKKVLVIRQIPQVTDFKTEPNSHTTNMISVGYTKFGAFAFL